MSAGNHTHNNVNINPSTPYGPNLLEQQHRADLIISSTRQGEVIIEKNRYGYCPIGKATLEDLSKICVTLLSNHLFRKNFNMFKAVFEDDLRIAIEEVLKFHGMRTSKKNHRKFSRKIKEREILQIPYLKNS